MEALTDMNILKKVVGGEDIITEVGDTIHGAFVTMMRRAKNNGQTFEQFMSSLFGKNVPDETMKNLREFWNTL